MRERAKKGVLGPKKAQSQRCFSSELEDVRVVEVVTLPYPRHNHSLVLEKWKMSFGGALEAHYDAHEAEAEAYRAWVLSHCCRNYDSGTITMLLRRVRRSWQWRG